jgi:glycosyltransferase involved in cell wall biosynthesis
MKPSPADVSVVVCVKNERDRIASCLAAVLELGAYEVLVVDGMSKDGTADVAKSMGVTTHYSILGTLGRDRQRGCYRTRGKYVSYIDADHRYESVVSDIQAWWPKVRPGGILSGHDYITAKLPSLMHVTQALHAWTDAYQIAPWFVLGRQAKIEGEKRDDGRSWFYVQPAPVRRDGKIQQ